MKRTLVTLGVSLALVTVILLAGNVIVIGDKLAAASPVFAWVFYGLLAVALLWLVVIPTCRILFAKPFPKLSVDAAAEDTPELRKELKAFARSLADNLGDLPAEEASARRSELLALYRIGSDDLIDRVSTFGGTNLMRASGCGD